MANYYNVTGWRNTGLNAFNRPISRNVLNNEWFQASENYFQMDGVLVSRDDILGMRYINLQGSVKDESGEQVNPPNHTGAIGPGGPWYAWEEVDYLRVVRTGYPGDVDYIDISGNMSDPWNAPRRGNIYIAYYFVTGLQPLSRTVTRLFLTLDEWTTLGGMDELTIETGFKIRGPITDAEDAASFNMVPEKIGLTEPLVTVAADDTFLTPALAGEKSFIVSSIDLTQYSEGDEISGFVAATASGQMVFPAIRPAKDTILQYNTPDGVTKNIAMPGYGFFNPLNTRVEHNLAVLYSAGQLELQDSYSVPERYILAGGDYPSFATIANGVEQTPCPIQRDIGEYPRKADYYHGQQVLYSKASGEMCILPFSEISDDTVLLWAVVSPSGYPIARFKGIKGHSYLYDQCVKGMTWPKKAVVLQGAAGSMWAQVNNAFSQQTLDRDIWMNQKNNSIDTIQRVSDVAFTSARMANNTVGIVASGASLQNWLTGGEQSISAINTMINDAQSVANQAIDYQANQYDRQFREQSLLQAQNQLNANMAQALYQAPYTQFVPDINMSMLTSNDFGVYIVNTSAKDRERTKNYFRRYGYSGLYKPLTWQEVNVKQKVNFIQCEGVTLRHQFMPMRLSDLCSRLLEQGVFLWADKPDQSAFLDNPDN